MCGEMKTRSLLPLLALVTLAPSIPATATDQAATKQEIVRSGDDELVLPLGLQADSAYIPEDNPVEMAMASHDDVVKEVARLQGYKALFRKAFGDASITMPRIAQAIGSYERTVLAGNAPYDRHRAGDGAPSK